MPTANDPVVPYLESFYRRNRMHKMIEDVKLFHKTFGHPILEKPTIPPADRQVLRSKMVRDEYIGEFDPAWAKCLALRAALTDQELQSPGGQHDTTDALAEFGDAIADVIYFLIGTALEYGIPLATIWDAVQEANMSKLWTHLEWEQRLMDGGQQGWVADNVPGIARSGRCLSVRDETGKVRKPPSWEEPNIVGIIKAAT